MKRKEVTKEDKELLVLKDKVEEIISDALARQAEIYKEFVTDDE